MAQKKWKKNEEERERELGIKQEGGEREKRRKMEKKVGRMERKYKEI